jgi:hypothetical protein
MTIDQFAECAGARRVVHWHIRRHLFFTWEVDFDALERLVPKSLEVIELRPGIGLMSTGVVEYEPGHFGPSSPVFYEVVSVIHVQPDLSFKMPVPRFAFYAMMVYSESPDFVELEARVVRTPTTLVSSLKVQFTEDGQGADAWDNNGPILSFRNTGPKDDFTHAEFYGQHLTDRSGAFEMGSWEWDGLRIEHMKPGGAENKIHQHPHFKGLDASRVRGTYRQMIGQPQGDLNERFFDPLPLGAKR